MFKNLVGNRRRQPNNEGNHHETLIALDHGLQNNLTTTNREVSYTPLHLHGETSPNLSA